MSRWTRREILKSAAAAAAFGTLAPEGACAAGKAPTAPVALGRCDTYELKAVHARLARMLDQVGGIRKLVAGKTVAVKVNLTGDPSMKALGLPAERTFQTHPNVILATAMLLDAAGAKRIRFVEGTYQSSPLEEHVTKAGWNMPALRALKAEVDFEDTRNRGKGQQYHRVSVPGGGSLFPAYELNHSYVDCDVYVSLAKMKNHYCAGVTLATKNNFGITPTALYGQDQHDENSHNARVKMFHEGVIKPAGGVPQEVNPGFAKGVTTRRVPRHTVDAAGMRPIHLAIIDGIETTSGGEGPWIQGIAYLKPNLLVAGRNPICTDAVTTAVMGYDPMAKPGTGPFPGDNHLQLASDLGLGTNDPSRIEVVGLSVKEALFPFKWEPAARWY